MNKDVKTLKYLIEKYGKDDVINAINEMGETPEGMQRLGQYRNQAYDRGRYVQGNKINSYLAQKFGFDICEESVAVHKDSIDVFPLGSNATPLTITDFGVLLFGGTKIAMQDLQHTLEAGCHVFTKPCARSIAKWCQTFLHVDDTNLYDGEEIYDLMCDWHTWARL